MEGITTEAILHAGTLILAVCGVIATIGKAADYIKSWRKPTENTAKQVKQNTEAITDMQAEMEALHNGQRVLCRGVVALLEHALHNGNSEEMERASSNISKWLQEKI